MADKFKSKLEFNNCTYDSDTAKTIDILAQSIVKQGGSYSAKLEIEIQFKDGKASIQKSNSTGLNADQLLIVSSFEKTALKSVSNGGDPAKIKAEIKVDKD